MSSCSIPPIEHASPSAFVEPIVETAPPLPLHEIVLTLSNQLLFLVTTRQAILKKARTPTLEEKLKAKYLVQDDSSLTRFLNPLPPEEYEAKINELLDTLSRVHTQKNTYSAITSPDQQALLHALYARESISSFSQEVIHNIISSAILHDDVCLLYRLHQEGISFANIFLSGFFREACSPLYFAIESHKPLSFSFLLAMDVPALQQELPTTTFSTPLHLALYSKKWEFVEEMLDQINLNIAGGLSPLRVPAENELFLNILLRDNEKIQTSLRQLYTTYPKYNLNELRPDLLTPLTYACCLGCPKWIIKPLIELGADPFLIDYRGLSPLQLFEPTSKESRYLHRRRLTLQTKRIKETFLNSLREDHIQITEEPPVRKITLILKNTLSKGSYKKIVATNTKKAVVAKFPRIRPPYFDTIQKEAEISRELAELTPYTLEYYTVEYEGKHGRKIGLLADRYATNLYTAQTHLSQEDLFIVSIELVSALSIMHAFSFIHGDLKLHNILITQKPDRSCTIKLCDFGSTKRINEPTGHIQTFPPPEIFEAEKEHKLLPALPSIDLWALSDILYTLLQDHAHKSLFISRKLWYDIEKPPDSKKEFKARAEEASCFFHERAKSHPTTLAKQIAKLASFNPLERPPALFILATLRKIAEESHLDHALQKADEELAYFERMLPRIPDLRRRDEETNKLAQAFADVNHRNSIEQACAITTKNLQQRELERIVRKSLEDHKLDTATAAAILLDNPEKTRAFLHEILHQYLHTLEFQPAYQLIELFPSKTAQEEAFKMIQESILSQIRPDILLANHVQELCSNNFLGLAKETIFFIRDPSQKERAITFLITKMIQTKALDPATTFVLSIDDPILQTHGIKLLIPELCNAKKWDQAKDLSSHIQVEELKLATVQFVEQQKAANSQT